MAASCPLPARSSMQVRRLRLRLRLRVVVLQAVLARHLLAQQKRLRLSPSPTEPELVRRLFTLMSATQFDGRVVHHPHLACRSGVGWPRAAGGSRSAVLGTCWKLCCVVVALVLRRGKLSAECSWRMIAVGQVGANEANGRVDGGEDRAQPPPCMLSLKNTCTLSHAIGATRAAEVDTLQSWACRMHFRARRRKCKGGSMAWRLGRTDRDGSCCGVAYRPAKMPSPRLLSPKVGVFTLSVRVLVAWN